MSAWPEDPCFRCGTVTRSWYAPLDVRCCPACADALTPKPQLAVKPPPRPKSAGVRDWRRRHPEKASRTHRIAGQLRRNPELRASIIERDGHRCLACNSRADRVIDHILPVLNGGDNDPSNLQTLCRPRNTRKRGAVDHRSNPISVPASLTAEI